MPLKSGTSHKIVSSNVSEMVKSGSPLKRAIAAALTMKRRSKMSDGGEVLKELMDKDVDESQGPEEYDVKDESEGPDRQPYSNGGKVEQSKDYNHSPEIEYAEELMDQGEARGSEYSDIRDNVESGENPKPSIPEDLNREKIVHKMDEPGFLTEELKEILRKRKMRYSE